MQQEGFFYYHCHDSPLCTFSGEILLSALLCSGKKSDFPREVFFKSRTPLRKLKKGACSWAQGGPFL
jgi:hypothetical protein